MSPERSDDDARSCNDGETAISPTELRALRRLAEPVVSSQVEAHELWASRYRIIEPLGRGGMGDVYLARDVLLDRLVALKVLRSRLEDELVDERLLLREARAAARAEHERIARVYDAGTWNDHAFIAMEYVRGQTLREWMKSRRASSEEVVFIVQQLLEGVRALHERELVHRDLKPENVMVASDGNLRILDLGIARRVPLARTDSISTDWPSSVSIGFGVGTPGYMAPEQWQAIEVDARADIFALGVIFYELVVGSAPFREANNAAVREKTLHGPVSFDGTAWESMPSALREVVSVALCRDREQRFANIDGMIEALGSVIRPGIAPISDARPRSTQPPPLSLASVDSSQASAMGVSIREPLPSQAKPKSRLMVVAVSVLALGAASSIAIRQHAASAHWTLPTRGMIRLPGATFGMGSDAEDLETACQTYPKGCPPEAQNEVPRHTVTVAPFEIDEREVTNQEYAKFLNKIGPSLRIVPDADDRRDRFVRYGQQSKDDGLLYDLWTDAAARDGTASGAGIDFGNDRADAFQVRAGFENLPVTQVSWLGAQLYCIGVGKRLPTEPEWEFAARGAEHRPYPWGDALPSCEGVHISSGDWLTVERAEQCKPQRDSPFPVGSAAQDITPEGVKDLAGNVSEWVDEDGATNRSQHSSIEAVKSARATVFRGAAFDSSFMARSTSRNFYPAFSVGVDIGFRCAKSATAGTH